MPCACAWRVARSNTIPLTCQDWSAGTTWKTPWRAGGGALGRRPAAEARHALLAFRPLAHRMELVGELDGVLFYDDSKGTNVGAVVAALDRFPRPVVLIAGGRDKGGSYEPLAQVMKQAGRGAVLIGKQRPSCARPWRRSCR